MHYSEVNITLDQMLAAIIIDNLQVLIWQNTKDGHKGRRRPASFLLKLLGEDKKKKDELKAFESSDEFDAWYKRKHQNG